jgi:hypothetical protein
MLCKLVKHRGAVDNLTSRAGIRFELLYMLRNLKANTDTDKPCCFAYGHDFYAQI